MDGLLEIDVSLSPNTVLNIFFLQTQFDFFSVHKRFSLLDPVAVAKDKNAKLPLQKLIDIPELKVC